MNAKRLGKGILPIIFFFIFTPGIFSGAAWAGVAEVTHQTESSIDYGNQGIAQLEKMIFELEKILQMNDASDGVKALTQASIDKANEALRYYKEALSYAGDGLEMSRRDEGAFIKKKKQDKYYDFTP